MLVVYIQGPDDMQENALTCEHDMVDHNTEPALMKVSYRPNQSDDNGSTTEPILVLGIIVYIHSLKSKY